jgi:predicted nucleic acid-binding protein
VIVLDASVLIGYLDARDAHHDRATTLLTREIDDDLAVNLLTLAEILVAPTRAGQCDRVLAMLADLAVETLQFPEGSAVMLAQLRAETHLKMPDCCVLLSALDQQARLASFDDRLVKAAQAKGLDIASYRDGSRCAALQGGDESSRS